LQPVSLSAGARTRPTARSASLRSPRLCIRLGRRLLAGRRDVRTDTSHPRGEPTPDLSAGHPGRRHPAHSPRPVLLRAAPAQLEGLPEASPHETRAAPPTVLRQRPNLPQPTGAAIGRPSGVPAAAHPALSSSGPRQAGTLVRYRPPRRTGANGHRATD